MSGRCWLRRIRLALGACALLACSPSDEESTDGGARGQDAGMQDGAGAAAASCDVQAPAQCPDPPVVWDDVEPIFMERCVGCHSGVRGGPWPLTSYSHAASWFAEIRAVMTTCQMPPADAGIAMSTGEREEILTWIRCGAPD